MKEIRHYSEMGLPKDPPKKSEHVYSVDGETYTETDFFKKFGHESHTMIGSHIGYLYVLCDKEKPSDRIYCLGHPFGPYHRIK